MAMQPSPDQKVYRVAIDGMTCRSCELTIEEEWREIPGVKKVMVNASHGIARLVCDGEPPSITTLQRHLPDPKYRVRHPNTPANPLATRPSWKQLVGLFALVYLVTKAFAGLGLTPAVGALDASMSLTAVFLLGLVAASSSCIAVSGGLLLSSVAKFNQYYSGTRPLQRMLPVLLFVAGRILAYSILGAVIGRIGSSLTPSPTIVGVITVIAALWMITMGLEMLHIAPRLLKRIMPRMPKSISRGVMNMETGQPRRWTPLLLGAGTFFLPCGFTQSLQLYALTTGSALTSASILGMFALGTAPALLGLGWASSSLKGKAGTLFFQFSGALVIVLGLWNIQNGFTIAGYPLSFPQWSGIVSAADGSPEGGIQTIRMNVAYGGYEPNAFTIRAGIPTRWLIDGTNGGGCASVLQAPRLGISQTYLRPGINTLTFTAPQPGTYAFSCSMGMYRGTITVVPNT